MSLTSGFLSARDISRCVYVGVSTSVLFTGLLLFHSFHVVFFDYRLLFRVMRSWCRGGRLHQQQSGLEQSDTTATHCRHGGLGSQVGEHDCTTWRDHHIDRVEARQTLPRLTERQTQQCQLEGIQLARERQLEWIHKELEGLKRLEAEQAQKLAEFAEEQGSGFHVRLNQEHISRQNESRKRHSRPRCVRLGAFSRPYTRSRLDSIYCDGDGSDTTSVRSSAPACPDVVNGANVSSGDANQPTSGSPLVRCDQDDSEEARRVASTIPMVDGYEDAPFWRYSAQTGAGRVNVHARVQALEQRNKIQLEIVHYPQKIMPLKSSAKAPSNDGTPSTPLVFPLHFKKFVRRTSQASPMRPTPPMTLSDHTEAAILQSPQPSRKIPFIRSPVSSFATPPVHYNKRFAIETPALSSYAGAERDPYHDGVPRLRRYGTRSQCVRHGRKQSIAQSHDFGGLPAIQHQNANGSGTHQHIADDDVCPDCAAEHSIRQRDLRLVQSTDMTTVMRTGDIEHITPRQEAQESSAHESLRADDLSAVREHVSQAALEPENRDQLVFSSDLGDDLEAVILEREGKLERIITNSRNGRPNMILMSRLAQELRSVSDAIAVQRTDSLLPKALDVHSVQSRSSENGTSFFGFDEFSSWAAARSNSTPEDYQEALQGGTNADSDTDELSRRWNDLHRSARQTKEHVQDDAQDQDLAPSPTADKLCCTTVGDHMHVDLTADEKKLLDEYGLLEPMSQLQDHVLGNADHESRSPTLPSTLATKDIDDGHKEQTIPTNPSNDPAPTSTSASNPPPDAGVNTVNTQPTPAPNSTTPPKSPPPPSSQRPTRGPLQTNPFHRRPLQPSVTKMEHEIIRTAMRMSRNVDPQIIKTAAAKERLERRGRLGSHQVT